jgi:hypothetical protein
MLGKAYCEVNEYQPAVLALREVSTERGHHNAVQFRMYNTVNTVFCRILNGGVVLCCDVQCCVVQHIAVVCCRVQYSTSLSASKSIRPTRTGTAHTAGTFIRALLSPTVSSYPQFPYPILFAYPLHLPALSLPSLLRALSNRSHYLESSLPLPPSMTSQMLRLEPFRVEGTETLSTALWHLKKEKELCSLATQVKQKGTEQREPFCWTSAVYLNHPMGVGQEMCYVWGRICPRAAIVIYPCAVPYAPTVVN